MTRVSITESKTCMTSAELEYQHGPSGQEDTKDADPGLASLSPNPTARVSIAGMME
ncbi:hypothetical protein PHLCEN_2v7521 [Hermanssonia centrifuga]|uniref:Uncharacterized protein n=1 Tax=Hermanssonia centrifuga TaxID=98765 RepID=A0A2R6NWB2_9APHY|nr:hypothetical protein PHLCEN_2v7521 [Hermanssonia centrifuga]